MQMVCVECGTPIEDVADEPTDEPEPDDIGGRRYWRERIARLEARRNTPAAIMERIEDDERILARAEASPPAPGSLAAMCVDAARDRRDREIIKLAEVETSALLTRIQTSAGRKPA